MFHNSSNRVLINSNHNNRAKPSPKHLANSIALRVSNLKTAFNGPTAKEAARKRIDPTRTLQKALLGILSNAHAFFVQERFVSISARFEKTRVEKARALALSGEDPALM